MALIVGYLLITNYQHFVHSVSGLLGILSPFITGFVIAYLLSGSQKKIEGLLERVPLPVVKKAKHGLSVLLLYLIILFIFVLTLNYIVPLLISNLVDLANSLPTFYDHMVQFVMSLEAVTLGILLGICNMIPYFGSIFASIVAGVITLFTGGVTQAITVLLVLLILQQIDGNIIGPRIMGDALNVNPILIIVSITIGGAYFGVLGMFLAVPVAAIIKIIVSEWLNESKENDKIVDSIES